ncbi:MAG TPA: redox-regulated ATPase YchF, partial [Deltaproteobacteria bacterium]|nr:redox-regulated ATPase YchF [Deltaproteobacteria bacterium]
MRIGLIGLEKSGKTSIFNALTGSLIDTATFSQAKKEPNIAVVEVTDPRIAKLCEMYQPRKTTYATIECMDFVGFSSSEEKKQIFPPSELALIKNADALALVLRNFNDDVIAQTHGDPDPLADMNTIITELIISDLIIAENRMERVEHYLKRGAATPEMGLEKKALERIIAGLNENMLIKDLELSADEVKHLRGFQFLTLKPLMVILNSDEDGFGGNEALIAGIEKSARAIEFAGRFEMELIRLSIEEAREFMEDMNIQASAKDRLTMLAYT